MIRNGNKKCPSCKQWYPFDLLHFYSHRGKKHGMTDYCKDCCKANWTKYREENEEAVLQQQADYREAHREELREYAVKYREENNEKIRSREMDIRLENIEAHREYDREYNKERRKNPKHRLNGSMSRAINKCIKEGKAGRRWESLVGYTLAELIDHLESQFTRGMTWKNYGEWHIDHIRPIADFNFDSTEDIEFRECWSLWNLQPLWAKDNRIKKNICDIPPLPLLSAK